MSILNALKQNETRTLATVAITVAAAAAVGCTVMAVRQDRLNRRMNDLEKLANLNADVTLNLTHVVGKLSSTTAENPIT